MADGLETSSRTFWQVNIQMALSIYQNRSRIGKHGKLSQMGEH